MKVKSVVFFLYVAAILSVASASLAIDLRITDNAGNTVDIKRARIGYTSYSFIYTPDFDYGGIRAYQGEGTITIAWDKIKSLTILKKDTSSTPYRLKSKITMSKDDKEIEVDLVMDSDKGLVGETDLGEYSIDLEKIKTITVIKDQEN